MPYQLVELSPVANDLEQLGTKEKFWFYFSDDTVNLQLFKYSRLGTGEHWSEKCAAELCHLLNIPHASYDLARYNGRFGVVTQKALLQIVGGDKLIIPFY
ncbi:Uncharacterised protein [Salmonella enterica subsp. enterica serovar Typhi]|nr:Uncharacterised protein [Salmonella enterica subsp. enterica serovar Typhi]